MLSRLHFVPCEQRFYGLLSRAASNMLEGARVLVDLLEDCAGHERLARHLEEIEHLGDELTHETLRLLARTFVTPMDREDVSGLASAIDDVLDCCDQAGRRIHLNGVAECTELARQFGHVIVEQAEQIAAAVPLLNEPRFSELVERPLREIHRLENEGDELLADAISHLYDQVTTVPAVIQTRQWEDIYQVLETATDKAEHVATVLRNIAVKNG